MSNKKITWFSKFIFATIIALPFYSSSIYAFSVFGKNKTLEILPKKLPPTWYGKLNIPSLIIGYGEANTREQALLMARKEIAESIRVQISAETNLSVIKTDAVTQSYQSNAISKTNILLSDTTILREENQGDYWYIAVSYDAASLDNRIVRSMGLSCNSASQSDYLTTTYLAAQIVKKTGCLPRLNIERNSSNWVINYQGNIHVLRDSDDFERYFYGRVDNQGLIVDASPSNVKNGEKFELKVSSNEDGYISIYNIYGRGHVTEIVSNIPISASKNINFPKDVFSGNELVATLVNKKISAIEMYVVLFNKSIDKDRRFNLASSTINSSNNSFLFDILLEKMATTRFATDVLRIESYD